MSSSTKTRHLLVTAAILLAGVIQLARGYSMVVVGFGCLGFLVTGNLTIYLAGSNERAIKRQQKRDYYAGKI